MSKNIKRISALAVAGAISLGTVSAYASNLSIDDSDSKAFQNVGLSPVFLSELRIDGALYGANYYNHISIDKYLGDSVVINVSGCGFKEYSFSVDGKEVQEASTKDYFSWNCDSAKEHTITINGISNGACIYTININVNVMEKKEGTPKIKGINTKTLEDGEICFDTEAEGDGDLLYKYEIQTYNDASSNERYCPYELLSDYSKDSKFIWNVNYLFSGGKYNIKVTVKNENGFESYSTYNFIDDKYGKMDEVSVNGVVIDDDTNEITTYLGDRVSFRAYKGVNSYGFYVNDKQLDLCSFYNKFGFEPEEEGRYKILLEATGLSSSGNKTEAAKKEITLNVKKKDYRAPFITKVAFNVPEDDSKNVECIVNDSGDTSNTEYKYEIFSKVETNVATGLFVFKEDKYDLVSDFSSSNKAEWKQEPIEIGDNKPCTDGENEYITEVEKQTRVIYTVRITAKNEYGYDIKYVDYELPQTGKEQIVDVSDLAVVIDRPEIDIPGTDTPGTSTPEAGTPGTDTPGTSTPEADTPGTDTPQDPEKDPATPTPSLPPDKENATSSPINPEYGDDAENQGEQKPGLDAANEDIVSQDKPLKPDNAEEQVGTEGTKGTFDAKAPIALLGSALMSLFVIKKRR